MRLTELAPILMQSIGPNESRKTPRVADAAGLIFSCPGCYVRNGGLVGTHAILIWFKDRGVPADKTPLPRWSASGAGVEDLTIEMRAWEPRPPPPCVTNGAPHVVGPVARWRDRTIAWCLYCQAPIELP